MIDNILVKDCEKHKFEIHIFKSDNSYDENGNDSKFTTFQAYSDDECIDHLILDLDGLKKLYKELGEFVDFMERDYE